MKLLYHFSMSGVIDGPISFVASMEILHGDFLTVYVPS